MSSVSISGSYSTIVGGNTNNVTSSYATISGGNTNNVIYSTSGHKLEMYEPKEGFRNKWLQRKEQAESTYSFIGGGYSNTISGGYCNTIGGGYCNEAGSKKKPGLKNRWLELSTRTDGANYYAGNSYTCVGCEC